ncbi:hypothetical protein KSP40_PGU011644 [Platanthera guangdongensis]|uniref:Gnk2-homologous domain-containing protein n=1 Tax=Platanthera guangdongensis TaxID=2320717 RepID=A0ABR2M905_9ASPA
MDVGAHLRTTFLLYFITHVIGNLHALSSRKTYCNPLNNGRTKVHAQTFVVTRRPTSSHRRRETLSMPTAHMHASNPKHVHQQQWLPPSSVDTPRAVWLFLVLHNATTDTGGLPNIQLVRMTVGIPSIQLERHLARQHRQNYFSLIANTPDTGYAISTVGNGSNTVYGLTRCRGDVGRKACFDCIVAASQDLQAICRGTSASRIWYEFCFLRYETTNFLGTVDNSDVLSWGSTKAEEDPKQFNTAVMQLLNW